MTSPRFEELLKLWQDGDASRTELSDLESFLRSDPRCRRALTGSILLEVDLYAQYVVSTGATATDIASSPDDARPVRPRHAFAPLLAIAASLLAVAVALFVFETETTFHRIESGEIWSGGSPVRAPAEDALLEVRGTGPARLRLKDGSQLDLSPISSGTIRRDSSERPVFVLAGGRATVHAAPGSKGVGVKMPAGNVTGADSQFFVERSFVPGGPLPDFTVGVAEGAVEVEYHRIRCLLRKGETIAFGLPGSMTSIPASDAEALLRDATLDLAAAVDAALRIAPGVPVGAVLEDDDGALVFSVLVEQGEVVREIAIDARSGAVVEDEIEDELPSGNAVATPTSLPDAVRNAVAKVPGKAFEIRRETRGGRNLCRITVFRERLLFEVVVDLEAGAVLELSSKRVP